jgi:hypothetical protein
MDCDCGRSRPEAGDFECVKPTGKVCPVAKKIEPNHPLGCDFATPAHWRPRPRPSGGFIKLQKSAIFRSNTGLSGECQIIAFSIRRASHNFWLNGRK